MRERKRISTTESQSERERGEILSILYFEILTVIHDMMSALAAIAQNMQWYDSTCYAMLFYEMSMCVW